MDIMKQTKKTNTLTRLRNIRKCSRTRRFVTRNRSTNKRIRRKNIHRYSTKRRVSRRRGGRPSNDSSISKYRWGVPHCLRDFTTITDTDLVMNTEGNDWYYSLPNPPLERPGLNDDPEKKNKFQELHNLEINKIHRKIEIIVNQELMPLISPHNNAKFFSSHFPISLDEQSISDNTFSINSEKTFCKEHGLLGYGNNPLTLVAIFCSMVKIMKKFVDDPSSGEYLLWLQQKAHIMNLDVFDRLVNDCVKEQFDVTWLWTKTERGNVGRTRRLDTANVKQFAETKLQYLEMNPNLPWTYGNTAVLVKRTVVQQFLTHLGQEHSAKVPVDLFREDVTFEIFVKSLFRQKPDQVAIVFEQDKHPIQYENLSSSYDT